MEDEERKFYQTIVVRLLEKQETQTQNILNVIGQIAQTLIPILATHLSAKWRMQIPEQAVTPGSPAWTDEMMRTIMQQDLIRRMAKAQQEQGDPPTTK